MQWDFSWNDEDIDAMVDLILRLAGECYPFKNEMFKGGIQASSIVRTKPEKQKEKARKRKNDKEVPAESNEGESYDSQLPNHIAKLVGDHMDGILGRLVPMIKESVDHQIKAILGGFNFDGKISAILTSLNNMSALEGMVNATLVDKVANMQNTVIKSLCEHITKASANNPSCDPMISSTSPRIPNVDVNPDTALHRELDDLTARTQPIRSVLQKCYRDHKC